MTQEGPGLEIGHVVLEDFQAIVAIDDLLRVVAAEECIRFLLHIVLGDTETDHGPIDLATFAKGPQEMLLL